MHTLGNAITSLTLVAHIQAASKHIDHKTLAILHLHEDARQDILRKMIRVLKIRRIGIIRTHNPVTKTLIEIHTNRRIRRSPRIIRIHALDTIIERNSLRTKQRPLHLVKIRISIVSRPLDQRLRLKLIDRNLERSRLVAIILREIQLQIDRITHRIAKSITAQEVILDRKQIVILHYSKLSSERTTYSSLRLRVIHTTQIRHRRVSLDIRHHLRPSISMHRPLRELHLLIVREHTHRTRILRTRHQGQEHQHTKIKVSTH